MEPADGGDDLGECFVRLDQIEVVRMHDITVDVVDDLAPSLVDPVRARSPVVPLLLQMEEQGMNAGRPRAGRATHGPVDPHDAFVCVPARKSLFHVDEDMAPPVSGVGLSLDGVRG
jgi:hypothetical protein